MSGFTPAGLNVTGGYLHLIGTNQVSFGSNVQLQSGGTMCVQGSSPSSVSAPGWDVLTGGTLKVNGTITGPVNVSGGTFAAGCSPGSADVEGDLFFDPSGSAEFELATPNIVASGNDWVSVMGNLTLNGTLNIVALPGFGVGTYRLFDYSGVLTDNGVHLGQAPNGFVCQLDVSTSGQVNLAVTLATPQSYDLSIPAGASLIANQLDHGSNNLSVIMSNVPDGSVISKYDNASGTWAQSTYSAATGSWSSPDLTLNPGEGAFLQSPTNFTLTFTGTPHVPVLPLSLPAGSFYLVSRQTNDLGTYENIVGLPPTDGAIMYRWTGSGYQVFSFDFGFWSPTEPSAAVGEALWIGPAGGSSPPSIPQSYTLSISNGLNLIANQLDHGSNTLNVVLPNVPDGSALYKYNNAISNGGWTISIYSAAVGTWLNGDAITLRPGEGAFLDSPSAFALTFTGTPHVPVLPVTIPAGQVYLLSRQTTDLGTYQNIVGNSPPDGATVYQWTGSGYAVSLADSGSPTGWDDIAGNPASAPTATVGGALWISPSGAGSPATPPVSTGLTVISPAAGNSLCAGTTTTITWSGGNPAWNVRILLADVPSWTVYSTIAPSMPNNGSFVWNIPAGLPASTYLIYIQEVSALSWTYGGNFGIAPCPTNACVPPPAGLGLWLPFDETSGSTSGNLVPGGNTGTRMNSPTVISGYVASSLSFNGANQFVTVPDYPAIDPGAGQAFSIDAWVKRAANAPDSLPSVIVDKRDPNSIVGYSLALSYGNLIFQMNDGTGYNNYRDTGTIPPDDRWHFIAVTITRNLTNGGKFYIDGVPMGTFNPTANPGSLASTAPFQIAASPIGGNRPWLGAIDEVEFFQRALLPSEVQAIFLAGSAGKCKCLTPPANMGLWLPLDEATGTISANLAPGGNSGTHVNSPAVISGYVANSLSFNGLNQYVTVPDYPAIDPLAGQNFSIDAWVKRSANSPNSPPSIIVDKRDANTGLGYSVALSYGNLIFQMNNGGSSFANYRDTGVVPPDNKWHLVAVTIIRNLANGGRFYIDGNPTGTFNPTGFPGSLASTAAFRVASSPLGGNVPWLGAIDEVEFFQRALTAQEVLAIFNAGATGKCKQGCGTGLALTCATNHTVECGSSWKFTAPTAAQASCSNISIVILGTVTNADPVNPCWQDITRTWLATDCCGHSNTCSQTITVADTTPPVVTCSLGFSTDCSFPWSFTPPTAVDACSGTNVTITVLSTTTNGHCPYSISRVWQIGDTCGNSTTCTQTVVVGDSTPPTISCTANKTVECGSQWDFDRPAAADACSGNTVTVTVLSTVTNGTACSQVITRTWVATNPCGYTNTCSQTVTTRDTTPPVFGLPGDKIVECGTPWTFDPPQVLDACCGQNVTLVVLSTATNGTAPCSLVATRTWRATDCCGNSATNHQTVTVRDTTPPVFATSCVTNVFFAGGSNNFTTPVASSPSAGLLARLHKAGITQFKGFDDCSVNTYFAHTFTNLPHCITAATLKVRMKPCGDLCYNDAISLSFTSASGVLQTNGSWGSYLGSGNPSPGLDNDNWCNHASGQTFVLNLAALPSGATPNLLSQLNANGFLDFTSQDDSGVDYLELTVVSCCYQPTKTVECGSQWTFDPPTATDACCASAVTVSVFSTVTNGICPKVATRTWQATDCCGNSSFFSQAVTMIDTTPPIVYCPGPIIRYVCTSSARVYYYVYAYDACSGYRTVTCTPASGSVFPLGTTIVNCTATDACGNVGSCSFPVTVTQQILTGSILLGLPDCYKLPTEPAIKSAALLAAHPGSCWKPFDDPRSQLRLRRVLHGPA